MQVRVFLTRAPPEEVAAAQERLPGVELCEGRPDIGAELALLNAAARGDPLLTSREGVGAANTVGVFACGPGALVSGAEAAAHRAGNLFHKEYFLF
jgi:hypothetical protein